MAGNSDMSRQERLAAKLRENLRRRKAQARALDAGCNTAESAEAAAESTGNSGAPLSKQAPTG